MSVGSKKTKTNNCITIEMYLYCVRVRGFSEIYVCVGGCVFVCGGSGVGWGKGGGTTVSYRLL